MSKKNSFVTIYSTPSCHFCHLAKAFFDDHGIEYKEFDVAADIEKRKEMIEKTGQLGVPVIEIGKNVVVGFDQRKIGEMLGI